jgi:chromate transporter
VAASRQVPSLLGYTLVVVRIALTSFGGGVSGWMMRVVVQEKGWMTETEFLSGLALCQVFPGINVLNLSIWLGYRLRGGRGAIAGGLAMIIPPALVLLALATPLAGVSEILSVRRALAGVAAAAVGLTGAMGLRAARRSAAGVVPMLILLVTFGTVGLLHWPLIPVMAVVAPVSVAVAIWQGTPDAR